MQNKNRRVFLAIFGVLSTSIASAIFGYESRIVELEMASDIVPSPVLYSVLLPPGYDQLTDPVPLLLNLHGGGGNRDMLKTQQAIFDAVWKDGSVPPMVVAMASVTERSFYMDFHDRSEQWETFVAGPFIERLRSDFKVRTDEKNTLITGISMGGMGSLRLAFKHPELFGVVAAMEPGIEPILHWKDMRLKHRFWRGDSLMQKAYGNPVDTDFGKPTTPLRLSLRIQQRFANQDCKYT